MTTGNETQNKAVMASDAVSEYINTEFDPQIGWYVDEAGRYESRLSFWTWMGVIFSFFATVIAALPDKAIEILFLTTPEKASPIIKWLIVIVSSLAGIASGVLVPRYHRLASNREKGRVKTVLLQKIAKVTLLYMPMTLEERAELLNRYAKDLMAIESEHGILDDPGSGVGNKGRT